MIHIYPIEAPDGCGSKESVCTFSNLSGYAGTKLDQNLAGDMAPLVWAPGKERGRKGKQNQQYRYVKMLSWHDPRTLARQRNLLISQEVIVGPQDAGDVDLVVLCLLIKVQLTFLGTNRGIGILGVKL